MIESLLVVAGFVALGVAVRVAINAISRQRRSSAGGSTGTSVGERGTRVDGVGGPGGAPATQPNAPGRAPASTGGAFPRTFISYRREDSKSAAGRLYDDLVRRAHAEPNRVFFDVGSVAGGEDFVAAIETALDGSDVLLVVIGPSWASVPDGDGRPRIEDPLDTVRVEVERGLDRLERGGLRVVPVLVDDADMPSRTSMPAELRPLLRRNAVRLRHESFSADMQQLVDLITN